MAEAMLRASAGVCVVATSREPLRAAAEYVYRVPSLDVPGEETADVDAVLRHGAVKLFVARAQAAEPRFVLTPALAPAAAAICRHLDGIPLAIELAAARIAAFGVDGVASRLDDRFRLLTGGSRTALPRQQTLRATLDWSHDLLSEPERVLLRRLSVLAGSFTLHAAAAIAAGPGLGAGDVAESVANLVAKSLVSVDLGGAVTSYRLLETTRAYAAREARRERRGRALQRGATPSIAGISSNAPTRSGGTGRPPTGWRRTGRGSTTCARRSTGRSLRRRRGARGRADDRRRAAVVPAVAARRVSGACRARARHAHRDDGSRCPRASWSCRPRSAGRSCTRRGASARRAPPGPPRCELAEGLRRYRLSAARVVGTLGRARQQRSVSPGAAAGRAVSASWRPRRATRPIRSSASG